MCLFLGRRARGVDAEKHTQFVEKMQM